MRSRSAMNFAAVAILFIATVVSGVAGPLHEIESFRGHEHCADGGSGPTIRHICHDEDACTLCSLLALSNIADPVSPPPEPCETAVEPPSTRPDGLVAVSAPYVLPARAPPVL